jgi:S-methylmethionine-dependent homocysteine/selenocysteine methylase
MEARYRDHLPPLDGELFLTDGGLETYLIFQRGLDLPEFAAFDLIKDDAGRTELSAYYLPYLDLASRYGAGFIIETPTWRANPGWGAAIGYDGPDLARVNAEAVELVEPLRDAADGDESPVLISGCLGPLDDGYAPGELLSADETQASHSAQVETFARTSADTVTAMTITYVEEALGIARAAATAGMPSVISFTVETDGRLPSGQALGEAVEEVDTDSDTDVAYFMINCAHPTHFAAVIGDGGAWLERIQGLRANASRMSHAELDAATELDDGDPDDLAAHYFVLRESMPSLNVLGGCCGTDHRHVSSICSAVIGDALV